MHDIITGLYNRVYFEEEMERLNNGRFSPITVICCDVDGLKLVNDTLGHKRGDELLKSVARALKDPFRGSDVVARVGGDEFAVILPKTGEESALGMCERIQQSVVRYNTEGTDVPISLSVGKATGDITKDLTCHDLYRRADNDMYRQKLQAKADATKKIFNWFVKSMDQRDFMDAGHARNVFKYAKRLGQEAGLPCEEIKRLELLARFHDIGKVGVSGDLLFKPGQLNKKEWEEVKQHSEIGFRTACCIPELSHIANYILHHHEWWNGDGYPMGLAGREIPLVCRIFSIAESFDVITSGRPYRRPMNHHEALREIQRCSRTRFDPQLAALFIEIMDPAAE